MGGPGRRCPPGGPTCRPADGDVPARCRFGDVTAHSRPGMDVTVQVLGDVNELGEAWQGKVGVAGRRISGEAERHRGPTGSVCPWGGQTLRHPAGAVKPTV